MVSEAGSYVAVRVVPRATDEAWWITARAADGKPPAMVALLNGRRRVELSAGEADAMLEWAATLAGWADADPKPIKLHPREPKA